MNSLILDIFIVYLILPFIGSVALSVFLLYDLWSGNYRKFLLPEDKRKRTIDADRSIRE